MKITKLRITFWILLCLLVTTACTNENNITTNDASAQKETISNEQTDISSVREYEYYLENGYYTVGIDIPSGICDIYATAGKGNILYSSDGTINTYSAVDDDLNEFIASETEKITDYTLKAGYVIHLSGAVRVKISFSQITGNCTGRIYDEENKVILKAGTYIVGTDFEAGVYTISAVEGNGNLTSSNAFLLGVDEMFGVFDGMETYVPKTVNVTLCKGDTLEVQDITIEMIKVKE